MPASLNLRTPAVKRILQEMKEIRAEMMSTQQQCPFACEALEGDIYEWCFAILGPKDTPFEGGVYHGRILLPPDYPFSPPSFVILTPSGRFEPGTKICLSISSHHPEQWQPSWSLRTALTALIAFFPSPAQGAVGSIDATASARARMAAESRKKVPYVASQERMEVMQRLHDFLLLQPQLPQQTSEESDDTKSSSGTETECKPVESPITEYQESRSTRAEDNMTTSSTRTIEDQQLAHQQHRSASQYRPVIEKCIKILDRIILTALMLASMAIAWYLIQ